MEKLFIRLQHTNRQIGSFRLKFNRQFLFLTWPKQSQYGALTYTYLFVSLRHWSSFFFVAGLPVFGISLAWVEHLRALFQFWSDHILHCHLQWGKLKQPFPFFLWITNREFFNELDMISVSFYVTVCHLRVYLRHYMVAVGMFYFSLRSISFWEWKKNRNRIDFALALWLVQKTHVTMQSEAKLKLIMTWSPWFSRALGTLGVLPQSIATSSKCFSFFWLLGRFWF